ncbi:MAG TPA: antibiotic biosynthesis monooxygenase [Clostridia bacterium]|nr:antibiotic biosynthesis monooxygenase [Clostridia bacterium]
MSNQVLSLAILEPVVGKEDACLALLRDFYTLLHAKGYSSDLLYRDPKEPGRFVHLRMWYSEEARSEAQQDPEVHRFWIQLPDVCTITTIHETLEQLFCTYTPEPA